MQTNIGIQNLRVLLAIKSVRTALRKLRSPRQVSLIKSSGNQEERYVLGVVLTPETVDAHGHIMSADEIRQAAHEFMAEYQSLDLQHSRILGDEVKILESYIAPADLELEGQPVRAGTWLMGLRILSDDIWQAVKQGELTGLSIVGSALEIPTSSTGTKDGTTSNNSR